MTEELDDDSYEAAVVGVTAAEVDKLIDVICSADRNWVKPERPVELPSGQKWLPHLVDRDRNKVLYVHRTADIRDFLVKRLRSASAGGFSVYVALELSSLYSGDVLRKLVEVDANVVLLDSETSRSNAAAHVLAVVGDNGVPVAPEVRREIALNCWNRLGAGSSAEKGRRLEALLAFLLGQLSDLRVIGRNYRTSTEEIDIILQIDNWSAPRCWHESGVPFILVEAKNWSQKVDQGEVSKFVSKLLTKRGRSRIGILFSPSGYTADAVRQEERLGQSQSLNVALFASEEIESWINAQESDDFFENVIRQSMLQ